MKSSLHRNLISIPTHHVIHLQCRPCARRHYQTTTGLSNWVAIFNGRRNLWPPKLSSTEWDEMRSPFRIRWTANKVFRSTFYRAQVHAKEICQEVGRVCATAGGVCILKIRSNGAFPVSCRWCFSGRYDDGAWYI